MQTGDTDRDFAADSVFQFVHAAFRQDQLRDDILAVFKWASTLPEDLDLLSQRSFLVLVRKAISEALEEVGRNEDKLTGQVPGVVQYLRQGTGSNIDDMVDRLAERFAPLLTQKAAFPTVNVTHSAPAKLGIGGAYSNEIGKADLDRIFSNPIDTNIGEIGQSKRFMKQSKGETNKLKRLRSGGKGDE